MSGSEQENHSENPLLGASEGTSGDAPGAEYQVGYKRPPRRTRFKPGQSGNPRGRPTGRPNAKTTVERVMNEKVSVREGEKTRHMTKFEAMLQAQTMKGMKGDARSAGMVVNVMTRTGHLGDQEDETAIESAELGAPADKPRPADPLFANIDPALLSDDEMIELSRLAEIIDVGGDITVLSVNDFQRVKQIVNKGRDKDVTPSERPVRRGETP
jgi:Family of unknown function (DUF5681)